MNESLYINHYIYSANSKLGCIHNQTDTGIFTNTVFPTVVGGTAVFVLGQIILHFFLEPLIEYKRTIGKIDYALKYHAFVYSSSSASRERKTDTLLKLRELSCELEANFHAIPLRNLFLNKVKIAEAATDLIGLANLTLQANSGIEASQAAERIRHNLKIDYLYNHYVKTRKATTT